MLLSEKVSSALETKKKTSMPAKSEVDYRDFKLPKVIVHGDYGHEIAAREQSSSLSDAIDREHKGSPLKRFNIFDFAQEFDRVYGSKDELAVIDTDGSYDAERLSSTTTPVAQQTVQAIGRVFFRLLFQTDRRTD